MVEIAESADLPTPAQMQALRRADEAARQARRMVDASRAVMTGNIAFTICLIGVSLTLIHSGFAGDNALFTLFILCGLVYGYLVGAFFALRWMKKRLAANPVAVVTRQEEADHKAPARKRITFVFALLFSIVTMIGWGVAFRHMSNGMILAALSAAPLFGMLFFVMRFALFQFWEDLLFAGCVLLAFVPFFLHSQSELDIPWLSLLSLPLVIIGTAFLQARWEAWARSVAGGVADGEPPGRLS
jgi:hypothetical protein